MVAEQLLHLHPVTLLLMLLNKLFEVKHMVTSNVIRVHMHIWRRTEALSLLIAIMVTCTSVIYSCFYGVQDLQYTFVRPTATYRRMVSYTYWSGSYLVLCGHVKRFVHERKRSVEAADSRHRRFELQQSNSKNVMGWASRWCKYATNHASKTWPGRPACRPSTHNSEQRSLQGSFPFHRRRCRKRTTRLRPHPHPPVWMRWL